MNVAYNANDIRYGFAYKIHKKALPNQISEDITLSIDSTYFYPDASKLEFDLRNNTS